MCPALTLALPGSIHDEVVLVHLRRIDAVGRDALHPVVQ